MILIFTCFHFGCTILSGFRSYDLEIAYRWEHLITVQDASGIRWTASSFCWSKVSFVESQVSRTLVQRMSCWKDSSLWLRRLLPIPRIEVIEWPDLNMSLLFDGRDGTWNQDRRVLFIGHTLKIAEIFLAQWERYFHVDAPVREYLSKQINQIFLLLNSSLGETY